MVIEKEEATAWDISPLFPHLLLPGLVEAHLEKLRLRPFIANANHGTM
jgi:hypothetical protein